MEYTGRVEGGVVVFDKKARPPDGTPVRIRPVQRRQRQEQAASELGKVLLSFAGRAEGLPDDMAENHDHYLYGVPKR